MSAVNVSQARARLSARYERAQQNRAFEATHIAKVAAEIAAANGPLYDALQIPGQLDPSEIARQTHAMAVYAEALSMYVHGDDNAAVNAAEWRDNNPVHDPDSPESIVHAALSMDDDDWTNLINGYASSGILI